MDLDLQSVLNEGVVVLWSGGLDSTGLIVVLLTRYNCKVYPIFIKHGQKNEKSEEKAVDHYAEIFRNDFSERFEKPFKVSSFIPAPEFKEHNFEKRHELRNSDLINNAVRFALEKGIKTILISTRVTDFLDGKPQYLKAKKEEIFQGTGMEFILISPFFDINFPCITKESLVEYCKSKEYPLNDTWSCWSKEKVPCGKCYPCESRKKLFQK